MTLTDRPDDADHDDAGEDPSLPATRR